MILKCWRLVVLWMSLGYVSNCYRCEFSEKVVRPVQLSEVGVRLEMIEEDRSEWTRLITVFENMKYDNVVSVSTYTSSGRNSPYSQTGQFLQAHVYRLSWFPNDAGYPIAKIEILMRLDISPDFGNYLLSRCDTILRCLKKVYRSRDLGCVSTRSMFNSLSSECPASETLDHGISHRRFDSPC